MSIRTIEAPGVEIKEIDKSGYAPAMTGTRCYIMGFANKGEPYVPMQFTSRTSWISYYGEPDNEAERYFFNACMEVINQNGVLYCARLPYDNEAKDNYTVFSYKVSEASTQELGLYNEITNVDKSIQNAWVIDSKNTAVLTSNTVVDELRTNEAKVAKNSIMIVDKTCAPYKRIQEDYRKDEERELLGIVPVITTAPNGMYIQKLISVLHLDVVKYETVGDIKTLDGKYIISSYNGILDSDKNEIGKTINPDLVRQLNTTYKNFSSYIGGPLSVVQAVKDLNNGVSYLRAALTSTEDVDLYNEIISMTNEQFKSYFSEYESISADVKTPSELSSVVNSIVTNSFGDKIESDAEFSSLYPELKGILSVGSVYGGDIKNAIIAHKNAINDADNDTEDKLDALEAVEKSNKFDVDDVTIKTALENIRKYIKTIRDLNENSLDPKSVEDILSYFNDIVGRFEVISDRIEKKFTKTEKITGKSISSGTDTIKSIIGDDLSADINSDATKTIAELFDGPETTITKESAIVNNLKYTFTIVKTEKDDVTEYELKSLNKVTYLEVKSTNTAVDILAKDGEEDIISMTKMQNALTVLESFCEKYISFHAADGDDSIPETISREAASFFPSVAFDPSANDGAGGFDRTSLKKVGVVVYKAYIDPQEGNKIAFEPVEAFAGSLCKDDKDINTGMSIFLDDIINTNSNYIYFFSNCFNTATDREAYNKDVDILITKSLDNCASLGYYSNQVKEDISLKTSIYDGMNKCFDKVSDINERDIDIVCDAGIANIASFTKAVYNTGKGGYNFNEPVSSDNPECTKVSMWKTDKMNDGIKAWKTVEQKFDTFCKSVRKDCMFIADGLRPMVLQGEKKIVRSSKPTNNIDVNILPYVKLMSGINTNYGAGYMDWFQITDEFSGDFFWCPPSIKAMGVYIYTDLNFEYWDAPAGLNRGVIQALDCAFSPTGKQAGPIYNQNWNYAINYPADGIVLEGQKTFQVKPSAFDRVNVRRLFLRLERQTYKVARYFVYEGNTAYTRQRLIDILTPMFYNAKVNGGIYDYKIICDESINTPDVIDRNELKVKIGIKPVKSAEYVLIDFIALSTGGSFSEM